MRRDGLSIKVAQGISGNANPQVTLGIYTETTFEDMQTAIADLENELLPNVPVLQQQLQ